MLIYNGPRALSLPYRFPISFCMAASLSNRKPEDLQNIGLDGPLPGGYLALVPFPVTLAPGALPMPLLFLPSSLLTIDIEVEEVAAPMHDGALLVPSFGYGAMPCTCRKCKTRAISISTFWPLEYVGYVRAYAWKNGHRYEGREEVPFDVYTSYDVSSMLAGDK